MILNMSIINMSHILRIVLIIAFKKCFKVRCESAIVSFISALQFLDKFSICSKTFGQT